MAPFSFMGSDDMAQQTTRETFSKVFNDQLNDIERRALKLGTNLTAVCRELGISRSTPDRWRRKTPHTIEILDQMDACVTAIEKKKQRREAAAA